MKFLTRRHSVFPAEQSSIGFGEKAFQAVQHGLDFPLRGFHAALHPVNRRLRAFALISLFAENSLTRRDELSGNGSRSNSTTNGFRCKNSHVSSNTGLRGGGDITDYRGLRNWAIKRFHRAVGCR
jgi:hypothetical protein